MVPATMTSVPAMMGSVTRSPRTMMARPLAKSGLRLRMDDATGAPTFWMASTRNNRPAAVPTTPEKMK